MAGEIPSAEEPQVDPRVKLIVKGIMADRLGYDPSEWVPTPQDGPEVHAALNRYCEIWGLKSHNSRRQRAVDFRGGNL